MTTRIGKCICCDQAGQYSIRLAGGTNKDGLDLPRYYIPNALVRKHEEDEGRSVTEEIMFCHPHMRAVEDNLRATILYLQAENGRLTIQLRE
jgi:hypothetical protein